MRDVLDANGKKRVTLIEGDGIGPEVVGATRSVLEAAGAPIAWEVREAGAKVFKAGLPSGVPPETIASIRETRVALKGPLETPVGFGEKSANAEHTPLRLKMVSNRGTKVYPATGGMTDCVDHWRCRFVTRDASTSLDEQTVLALLEKVGVAHRWMHVEKLEEHDGALAYTRAQGED